MVYLLSSRLKVNIRDPRYKRGDLIAKLYQEKNLLLANVSIRTIAKKCSVSRATVCRTLIDGYSLGLRNIYQFEGIENDPLLCAKRGMEKLPDQTVLRKDLKNQFKTDEDVNRLRRVKAQQVRGVMKGLDGYLVLEYDSTVDTGYGSQEGLEVGTNPHKRGRAPIIPNCAVRGKAD